MALGIARAIDLSHPPFADRRDDIVGAEFGARRKDQGVAGLYGQHACALRSKNKPRRDDVGCGQPRRSQLTNGRIVEAARCYHPAFVGVATGADSRGCNLKSGKCPKCQSTDVRVGPPGPGARGPMNKFAVSFWKNIVPERHICISCGYMEQYVADPADRAAIGSNWPARGGGSTA